MHWINLAGTVPDAMGLMAEASQWARPSAMNHEKEKININYRKACGNSLWFAPLHVPKVFYSSLTSQLIHFKMCVSVNKMLGLHSGGTGFHSKMYYRTEGSQ